MSESPAISPESSTPSPTVQCPGCQGRFECQILLGHDRCWCMQRPAVLPVTDQSHCLCPNCLDAAILAHQSGMNQTLPEAR